jgi:hypothetical protein
MNYHCYTDIQACINEGISYTYNVQWNSETSYQTYVNHAYTVTISYPAFNKNQVQEKL